MDQSRRKKSDPRDILPPMVGLLLIGVLFVPGIPELFGSWFAWLVGLLSLAVVVLIIRAIRMRPVEEVQEEPLLPIFIHSDEERAQFRAMCGVKQPPPPTIKVVTPHVSDTAPTSDSPPNR